MNDTTYGLFYINEFGNLSTVSPIIKSDIKKTLSLYNKRFYALYRYSHNDDTMYMMRCSYGFYEHGQLYPDYYETFQKLFGMMLNDCCTRYVNQQTVNLYKKLAYNNKLKMNILKNHFDKHDGMENAWEDVVITYL